MNILASTLKIPLMADFCFSIMWGGISTEQEDKAFSERGDSRGDCCLLLFALICWEILDTSWSGLRLEDGEPLGCVFATIEGTLSVTLDNRYQKEYKNHTLS
jgi:hypothetical protein